MLVDIEEPDTDSATELDDDEPQADQEIIEEPDTDSATELDDDEPVREIIEQVSFKLSFSCVDTYLILPSTDAKPVPAHEHESRSNADPPIYDTNELVSPTDHELEEGIHPGEFRVSLWSVSGCGYPV